MRGSLTAKVSIVTVAEMRTEAGASEGIRKMAAVCRNDNRDGVGVAGIQ